MTKPSAYHIMRVAMGITFAWIGILIFKEPEFWGGFVQPWAAGLLPVPLKEAMIGTAVLDLAIGLLLLVDAFVWIVALVATLHLGLVITVSGIDSVTVRDIGLLGAAIMLFWEDAPESLKAKFRRFQH
ncbi:hypothetical protein A2856_02555 [Candidatus Uhrbacteria bacterium RIFCSPHIGHO2_01_FULL_63_20]|uniref:DoxX family protein n=1 Tax=Candidatus Uhrbacteria bacterium RIFCSPHIGHO2_01_FULL_63_20 TaxID=1802385 RepID=A0A1F7TLQ0_9BACT|nr:MAG: hypothetical protein A2856_02555 [Candidatus Uhrbacteria bacterium RIFCSPHIGHO2_01_FULL_63_20]